MSDKTRWRTLYHFEFAHTPEKSIPIIGIMRQRFSAAANRPVWIFQAP
ncbi:MULTISPECIES: hypothetical protein [Rhizobium]|nr:MULTISPECIES: hypothetical protein [Rhizobium]MBY3220868.1 hypothetical protein [Rhizobium laguerreae]MCW1752169.1 hypothetical protein [Rhizobium acaciae]